MNWSDPIFGQSVSHFMLGEYKNAKRLIKRAIKCFKEGESIENINTLIYFRALCYKKMKKENHAVRDYQSL